MRTSLERTNVQGVGDCILTAGGTIQTANGWAKCFGCFANEKDARSPDADGLAIATVGRDAITDEQAALAERNSAAI